jgi:hypothetical protein
LALGFLATKARSDEITLSLPPDLAAPLADALGHLQETATGGPAPRLEGLDLTARRDTLRELLAVAIDEAGERVSSASTRLLRGESAPAELRAELIQLGALLDLLETVSV